VSAVEDFQTETERLADTVRQHVLALYAAHLAGEITDTDVVALIAAAINQGTSLAVALGDVWLVAQIEEQTGVAALATGVAPTDDAERLVKAVDTVLLAPDTATMRLERLARSETFEAAQTGTWEAIQRQPLVQGWVRQSEGQWCQLCDW